LKGFKIKIYAIIKMKEVEKQLLGVFALVLIFFYLKGENLTEGWRSRRRRRSRSRRRTRSVSPGRAAIRQINADPHLQQMTLREKYRLASAMARFPADRASIFEQARAREERRRGRWKADKSIHTGQKQR
jgi:hypothetical protein